MDSCHRLILASLQLCLLLLVSFTDSRSLKCSPGKVCPDRPPVVLIPGDLGNQLEVKLDKPSVVHFFCCKKTKDYVPVWLNLESLLPGFIDCWIDNMRLLYNRTSHFTEAPPGVDVRVPGFGQTYSLEHLDTSIRPMIKYFFTIVQALVEIGYTRNDDVRGAPYDWRKAPNENKEYFLRLKQMIEEMANKAGGPVVLIAHSMGNMYTLYFLQKQTQAWKDLYIKAFVSLGSPWAGVAKTLKAMATGENDHIPFIKPLKIRTLQRTAVSTAWLLPFAYTWPKDMVLVSTSNTSYTVQDYKRFFKDIDYEDGWAMRQDTEPLVNALNPPGVTVHCLYGSGIPTPQGYNYTNFSDTNPTVINGDGDGTVNLLSATLCKHWENNQKQPVYTFELLRIHHIAILSNEKTVNYIKNVLLPP
ncbi:phospholipase A2 group XV-like isoform X1 [Carassius carassius]|uniref:phospholipase A2 group XV-like isoform X1 n=1 Tax=Carassius carassius TaxID=217509 RepID=UPI0028696A0E|nr:phospholipase A2 group XV-like isoform X1 [Carassius carassius]